MKMILNDIKLLIEYKLRTQKTHLIYKDVCFNIIDAIESLSYIDNHKGNEVTLKYITSKVNRDITVINRHINWLIDEKILWRSKLSYTKVDNKPVAYDTYRYSIHNNFQLTNLERFIFTTSKNIEYNKKYEMPEDGKLQVIWNTLHKFQVDIDNSLRFLFEMEDVDNKQQQSKQLYKILLKQHKVSTGTKVDRIYHTITGISSDLHQFLYIDGYIVSELDAKASQITLISNLTRYVDNILHTKVDNGEFYEWIVELTKERLAYEESIGVSDGKLKWFDESSNSMFSCHHKRINKKVVKPSVYAALFSSFTNNSLISKIIIEECSDVITEFHNIIRKSSEYINFISDEPFTEQQKLGRSGARLLQNLETKIWYGVVEELILHHNIKCVNKHDSILYTIDNKDIVMQVITKHMYKNNVFFFLLNETDRNLNTIKFTEKEVDCVFIEELDYSTIQKNIDHSTIQKNIGNTDLTNYTFLHKDGRTFTGIKSVFIKEYSLDKKSVNSVIKGERNSVGGWVLNK